MASILETALLGRARQQKAQQAIDDELLAAQGALSAYQPTPAMIAAQNTPRAQNLQAYGEALDPGYTPIDDYGNIDMSSIPDVEPVAQEFAAEQARGLEQHILAQPKAFQAGRAGELLDVARGVGSGRLIRSDLGDRVEYVDSKTREVVRTEPKGKLERDRSLLKSKLGGRTVYRDAITGELVVEDFDTLAPSQELDYVEAAAAAQESGKGSAAGEGQAAKDAVSRASKQVDDALSVVDVLPDLYRTRELAKTVKIGGSAWGQAKQWMAQKTGYQGADEVELTQAYANMVISSLRASFGGNPTEGERAALAEANASIGLNPEANLRAVERLISKVENRINRGISAAESLGRYGENDLKTLRSVMQSPRGTQNGGGQAPNPFKD